MTAIRTARDRARAELTQEIKAEARRQLGEHGATQLSLRAVAKELGMVSSALYRYFPSRDQLLTALIIDAYNALGDAADAAVDPAAEPRARWQAVCRAVREWARAHPHEYALIYGTPIPGYQAPPDTIGPAIRVALLLAGLVAEAFATGSLVLPGPDATPLPPALEAQATALGRQIGTDVPPLVVTRVVVAWTQLFGMISFELFGQYVGGMDPAEPFAAYVTDELADYVGLRSPIPA
jgi:AcrR family transcriptional regulator